MPFLYIDMDHFNFSVPLSGTVVCIIVSTYILVCTLVVSISFHHVFSVANKLYHAGMNVCVRV